MARRPVCREVGTQLNPAALLPHPEALETPWPRRGVWRRVQEWMRETARLALRGQALRFGEARLHMRVDRLEAPGSALEVEIPPRVNPAA